MVAIDRLGHVYPSVQFQDMLSLAQKSGPLVAPMGYPLINPVANVLDGGETSKVLPSQFGLSNHPSLQFATPGGGSVEVYGPLNTPGNNNLFNDPNPLIIRKKAKPVTYVQNINLAYYAPPAPPPPGPVIIKEVRAPQAPTPPPLFVRIRPPPPLQQAPLVIREAPPPPPRPIPATHLTRVLPPLPTPPPRVRICNAPDPITVGRTLNNLGLRGGLC